ncbi:hypothetical protein BX600DRAFT_385192 [Xylariales sp. PMI_506]|nr:hypothetical protein BX600DRAFT_385192 [Xylariales sp. PMI_506]
MARLIKSHLARLLVLTAASYHVAATLQAFIWPKIFWDSLTKSLDLAVTPHPVLQIINLLLALVRLAWEWPLRCIIGSAFHQSIKLRIIALPLVSFCAILLYQATNAAIYYLIGMAVYAWAYSECEFIGTY